MIKVKSVLQQELISVSWVWSDQKYHNSLPGWDASPLQGCPPPPPCISSGFPDKLLVPIHTPGWREALFYPSTQHVDLAGSLTQTSRPWVQPINHWAAMSPDNFMLSSYSFQSKIWITVHYLNEIVKFSIQLSSASNNIYWEQEIYWFLHILKNLC